MKGVKRSAWLRMGAAFLLGAVFLGALAAVIYRQEDYRKGAEDYVEAREIAGLAEPKPLPVASSQLEETTTSDLSSPWADIDLDALQAVNEDVLGWITIPGTELSYPLVQGADNDYYLDHTWNHERAAVGSIFLECSVSPDFTDYNSLIYGHRMHNGSMFGVLRNYLKTDFWRQAPASILSPMRARRVMISLPPIRHQYPCRCSRQGRLLQPTASSSLVMRCRTRRSIPALLLISTTVC